MIGDVEIDDDVADERAVADYGHWSLVWSTIVAVRLMFDEVMNHLVRVDHSNVVVAVAAVVVVVVDLMLVDLV